MADRGMGIRIFNNKEHLQDIFESFEEDSDEEGKEDEDGGTDVVTSQLRHFVMQVRFFYFARPFDLPNVLI
jgi:tubulin--tyrosine ligase